MAAVSHSDEEIFPIGEDELLTSHPLSLSLSAFALTRSNAPRVSRPASQTYLKGPLVTLKGYDPDPDVEIEYCIEYLN